ncbi:MAG TPA: hypothetical protein PK995_07205 [Bacteroidia bacterium]|nr:hypothetical protein [Bacteroidia bacterium]
MNANIIFQWAKKFAALCCTAVATFSLNAQNVGISPAPGSAPSGDAGLDVNFTDKGVLIPRVNLTSLTTYAPITGGGPTESMLVYNTNTTTGKGYYYWNGGRWVKLLVSGVPADAWLTTGNASTIAGTNFLGTTNAVDLVIKTNNTERMRVTSGGQVVVNNTTPLASDMFSSYANATGAINAISGYATAANSYGVLGRNSSATGFGVLGFNSNISGTGVLGAGNNVTPNYLGGGSGGAFSSSNVGVYGYGNTTSLSWGVYGNSAANDGTGVVGICNGATGTGVYGGASTSGGVGIYAFNSNASGTGLVAGGNNILPWYLMSGSGGAFTGNPYGITVFKNGALTNGQWAGYFIASTTSNVGVVIAGRNAGINYKILNLGAFGGNVSTDVWGESNDPNDRKIMFCPEASEILLQDIGKGKLVNGKCHIDLDPIFAKNIIVNDEHPLRVFIQLRGNCNGVYVTNESKYGFDVIELNNGTSNVEFNYMVVANRDDYVHPVTKEVISKHVGVRFPQAPNPEDFQQFKRQDVVDKNKEIIQSNK